MDSQNEEKKVFLRRNVDTIFIMLGHECNLNCKYCLQHPLVHEQISHNINPDIYDFIAQVCKESVWKPRLQFFGGEPTLFFKTVKEIVEEVAKRKLDIAGYSLLSNGKLINEEMVEFFNKHKFIVGISWDGYNVKQTRGYNAFEDPEHRALILKIDDLWVSAVLSAYNSPKQICAAFQELDEEYYKIHNNHILMNVDDIFDTGGLPEDLLNINYDLIMRENTEMAQEFLQDWINGDIPDEHYARNVYINQIYNMIHSFYMTDKHEEQYMFSCCGNGFNVLNMGLDGTLYPCHNTSETCGTIYSSYESYLEELLKTDNTKERYQAQCKDCIAMAYCRCGCKLVPDKEREESYCKLKKAVCLPVISMLQNFKEENYKKGDT